MTLRKLHTIEAHGLENEFAVSPVGSMPMFGVTGISGD